MKTKIFIVGAGGHAKVVSEIIQMQENYEIVSYIDESGSVASFLGKPVFRNLDDLTASFPNILHGFVAIGNNSARKKWHLFLKENGYNIPWFAHPKSVVSSSSVIGDGSLVCASAVVAPSAQLAESVIINHGAIIDHDVQVGSFTHISQNSAICGAARVQEECLIGPGTMVEKMALVPGFTQTGSNAIFCSSAVR
ncbi:hypothetical protein ACES2L_07225 [Bdellovibrio bacteriovorus]